MEESPTNSGSLEDSPDHAYMVDTDEPCSFEEAVGGDNKGQWKIAIEDEYASLLENRSWDLVVRPKQKDALPNRWIFKVKRDDSGNVIK